MINLNMLYDNVHPGLEITKGMVDFGDANGDIWSFGYLLKEERLGFGLLAVVGVR